MSMSHPKGATRVAVAPMSAGQMLTAVAHAVTASRANYCASYVVDFACPLVLGYLGAREATGLGTPAIGVAAGLFTFTFIEYAVHRWLFHRPTGLLSAMHHSHHQTPDTHAALPFFTSAGVAAICWPALTAVIGSVPASFFLCGVMGGYFYYAALHHLEHSVRINAVPFRWMQRRWAMHSVHHHLAGTNFGVTTSFWDRVFATHYQSKGRAPGH
jgi:sterol desaturase/sphingolipid hydroxylase (fatty acid hydroxylase superfamily)